MEHTNKANFCDIFPYLPKIISIYSFFFLFSCFKSAFIISVFIDSKASLYSIAY